MGIVRAVGIRLFKVSSQLIIEKPFSLNWMNFALWIKIGLTAPSHYKNEYYQNEQSHHQWYPKDHIFWGNTIDIKTLNMLNYFKYYRRHIHISIRILDLAWTKWMKSTPGRQYTVVSPTEPTPCLLMIWRLWEPGHHQAWYWWSLKPKYSVSSIRKVNTVRS